MLLLTNIRATEYILNLFDITHITRVGQEFELFILNIYAFRYLCLPLSVCPCLFFSLSQNKKKKSCLHVRSKYEIFCFRACGERRARPGIYIFVRAKRRLGQSLLNVALGSEKPARILTQIIFFGVRL